MNKYRTYKKDLDYSYTLGISLTIELLTYQSELVQLVYISTNTSYDGGVAKIIEMCQYKHIPVEFNDKIINILSPKQNCYAIGIFRKYELPIQVEKNHIVLVNPSDSGNLGTIIRTSLGFGIRNMAIIRPGVDVFDPKVIRSSMGAIFHVSIEYFDRFEDYIERFSNQDLYTFMLDAKMSIHDIKMTKKPFSLIFGNEAKGLDESYRNIGTSVIIPHQKDIDSLNLSIAVGIAEYEFTKYSINI